MLLPEDECDDVGVLLEGAGFAEVCELRAVIGARFANLVCSRRNASRTMPVGPLRCLATISSAVPASGLFGSRL